MVRFVHGSVVRGTDVPCETLEFRPLDGRALEETSVGLHVQTSPVGAAHGKEAGARMQAHLVRRTGKTHPRARLLATVATIDAVTQAGGCLGRDFTAVLDGQVRQAATGVEVTRTGQCARRTGTQAAVARAAARGQRRVIRQRAVDHQLAQEEG